MTELTPAQKLRVAAAISEDGVTLRLDRKTAMELARAWEDADRMLSKLEASQLSYRHAAGRFEALTLWALRITAMMGLAQAVAAWWLL